MTKNETKPLVRIENLTWWYDGQRILFHEFDFHMNRGEFCFVVGKSGSGKTSLMKLITGQIMPPTHTVYLQDDDVARLKDDELQALRRRVWVVYQDYKLLSDRSVYDNIVLPLQLQDIPEKDAEDRVKLLVKHFGFEHHLHHKVSLLSGWEKQKVAIMRALITTPQCLFADEPTGNLDRQATTMIADMLIQANQQWHTILCITHDTNLIAYVQEKLAGVRVVEIV